MVFNLFFSKIKNIYSLTMSFIYLKYTMNTLINNNITLFQYEFSRAIMWLFATPIMLKMYCNVNFLELNDIYFLCHYIPCFLNVLLFPLKHKYFINYLLLSISAPSLYFFLTKLLSFNNTKFTKIFFYIWIMFILLTFIDFLKILDKYTINILYLTADMIGKVTVTFIIHDYKEQQHNIIKRIDLQCINFISYILSKIDKYKISNVNQTKECDELINHIVKKLNRFIPEKKKNLQIELLRKLLPFGFDQNYIENTSTNKQFNKICVLFTDIVSYTELAHKYEDIVIFELLNNIYIRFDTIIKKYSHLQKIETIGDAYMVVGDIFKDTNDYKMAVRQIILLALDFMNEIKLIKTPDGKPLTIRIGIHIGSVIVGILGNEIPRLCIVGNTVNIASRLQSTSDQSKIQISEELYEIAKNIFFDINIEYVLKENVFLKNIGCVNTYIITNY